MHVFYLPLLWKPYFLMEVKWFLWCSVFGFCLYTMHKSRLSACPWLSVSLPNPEGCKSWLLPIFLSVMMVRERRLGLYDPDRIWTPVVAPQTQEIPLLLLHSSVVAARLCVYFCGTDPVCMCQSQTGFFRRGVTVLQGRPSDQPNHSPEGRPQEKLNKHNHGLFLMMLPDTPIGWPISQAFFHWSPCFPHCGLCYKES